MATSKAFAAVDTLPKADKKVINPRATRYGMLPIWDLPTLAKDFYVWSIPANTVFPFRPFVGEVIKDINDNVLHVTERMPQDQILDLYNMTTFFVELTPLAQLNDEAKAARVVEVLANPSMCDKYPVELGNSCVTCWFKDSLTKMEDRIKEEFKDDAELRKTARDSMKILQEAFTKAIDEARRKVDVAIRDIDDPKSGKTMFFPADYLNVYHTHADRPVYKTSTNANANVGTQIAEALQGLMKKEEAPTVDIAAVVAAAVAEATKGLRDELDAYKSKEDKKEAVKEKLGKKD